MTHDLGENTLHRLNFRLTLQPAASRTDSLAGISVVVQEAFDNSLILESYAKLVVASRKKLEELVKKLLIDRASIFDYKNDIVYILESYEQESVDKELDRYFNTADNGSLESIDDVSHEGKQYYEKNYTKHLSHQLMERFQNFEARNVFNLLTGRALNNAINFLKTDCRGTHTIDGLLEQFGDKASATAVEDWRQELQNDLKDKRDRLAKLTSEPNSPQIWMGPRNPFSGPTGSGSKNDFFLKAAKEDAEGVPQACEEKLQRAQTRDSGAHCI